MVQLYDYYYDIRRKHDLVVVMRDNAGENKLHEIMEFLESKGIRNHFSVSYEPWQNGLAESEINSIMRLTLTVMDVSWLCSGSRPPLQVKMHVMLHTSRGSGKPLTSIYMVSLKMFYSSALSDAGHGCTSMRKGRL
jgi:hypothetical protein